MTLWVFDAPKKFKGASGWVQAEGGAIQAKELMLGRIEAEAIRR
jgi:hypothetical protein